MTYGAQTKTLTNETVRNGMSVNTSAPHEPASEVVTSRVHQSDKIGRMSVDVIETIADAAGLDPTQDFMSLGDYIEMDYIDHLPDQGGRCCVTLSFDWEEYHIECCCCGLIEVFSTNNPSPHAGAGQDD